MFFSSYSLSFGLRSVSLSTFDFSWDSASVPCLSTLSFEYLLTPVVTGGLLSRVRFWFFYWFCSALLCNKCSYAELRLFPFPKYVGKRFLTDNLGHTFLIDTRIMEPLWAQKKIWKITAWLGACFQISCPLYNPIRVYLRPHQNILLNLYYQSWQRQTMLRNNSCQSLGCVYADLYSCYCFRTVIGLLTQCFEILRHTCWSSSNLNIFTRYSCRLEGLWLLSGRNNRNRSCTLKVYSVRYQLSIPNVTEH